MVSEKTKKYIEKCVKVHGDKYDYSNVEYVQSKFKVKIICPKHGEFEQRASGHLKGYGCRKCVSDSQRLDKNTFINKSHKVHGDLYDYSKVNYVNYDTDVIIICPKHGEFKQTPNNHLKGANCLKCSFINRRIKKIDLINEFEMVHKGKYDYSKIEYETSHVKINIICPKHGEFKQSPHDHKKGKGCPICNESKGEKAIRELLELKKIKFISQYKFDDCKHINPLPFDFYLPEHNICVEYNGIQHYKMVEHFGGKDGFERTKNNDKIKVKFCSDNNIRLITIKYNEKVSNLLNKIKYE